MRRNYFKADVSFLKLDEATGEEKNVTESYLIEGVNYTDAEARTHAIMEKIMAGTSEDEPIDEGVDEYFRDKKQLNPNKKTFTVKDLNKFRMNDVIDIDGPDQFWLCKSEYLISSNKGVKKVTEVILVNAPDDESVVQKLKTLYKTYDAMIGVRTKAIVESPILEVFNQ